VPESAIAELSHRKRHFGLSETERSVDLDRQYEMQLTGRIVTKVILQGERHCACESLQLITLGMVVCLTLKRSTNHGMVLTNSEAS